MLLDITALGALIFSVIYPLCFWIKSADPVRNDFHKFHIGLSNGIGGVTVVFLLFTDISLNTKIILLVWKASLIAVSRYSWKRPPVDPRLMTIPCLAGLWAFSCVRSEMMGGHWYENAVWILAGAFFCAAFFIKSEGVLDKNRGAQ